MVVIANNVKQSSIVPKPFATDKTSNSVSVRLEHAKHGVQRKIASFVAMTNFFIGKAFYIIMSPAGRGFHNFIKNTIEDNNMAMMTRRRFLASSTALAFPTIVPSHVLGTNGAIAPSNQITLGQIGFGWIGGSHLSALLARKDNWTRKP